MQAFLLGAFWILDGSQDDDSANVEVNDYLAYVVLIVLATVVSVITLVYLGCQQGWTPCAVLSALFSQVDTLTLASLARLSEVDHYDHAMKKDTWDAGSLHQNLAKFRSSWNSDTLTKDSFTLKILILWLNTPKSLFKG